MRRVFAVTTLSTLLACGGSSPAPAPVLTLTCGTYNAGEAVGTVVAAVFDPVRTTATDLTVDGVAGPRTVTCAAGQRLCLTAMPELAAWQAGEGTAFQVTVTTGPDAGSQRFTCKAGSGLLAQPGGTAAVNAGQVTATWAAVPGAVKYRATLRDLGPPGVAPATVLDTLTTTATQATFTLTGATPELAVVEVEAWAIDPAVPLTGALPAGRANRSMRALPFGSAPWTLKLPSDFSGTTLTLPVPAGQRLAVTLINVGGPDYATATIQVAGAATSALVAGTPQLAHMAAVGLATPGPWPQLTQPFQSPSETSWSTAATGPRLASAAPTPPATTTFCTRNGNFRFVRRPATLVRETATGIFYVDDANAAEYAATDWDALVAAWEALEPQVTGRTGPAPDVDGNGKLTLFFTSAMGPSWGGNTVWLPPAVVDTSAGCTQGGGNGVDLLNLHSPVGMIQPDGTPYAPEVVLGWMPYVMSHEFQHLVDMRRFCLDRLACGLEEWVLEGRAELSAVLFTSRVGRNEIFQRAGPAGGYGDLRLLPFDGSLQAYAGVSSFFLYLEDRLGPVSRSAFFQEGSNLAQLEAISGLPFPVAYGLWTSALLFSNEPANPWPVLDYTGAGWTPLHTKYQRFEFGPLSPGAAVPVTLRRNGFDVYVTGVADSGGGTVTITSSAVVKPHVVVVPFTGALP